MRCMVAHAERAADMDRRLNPRKKFFHAAREYFGCDDDEPVGCDRACADHDPRLEDDGSDGFEEAEADGEWA